MRLQLTVFWDLDPDFRPPERHASQPRGLKHGAGMPVVAASARRCSGSAKEWCPGVWGGEVQMSLRLSHRVPALSEALLQKRNKKEIERRQRILGNPLQLLSPDFGIKSPKGRQKLKQTTNTGVICSDV